MLQRNNQFWDYFLRRYEKVRETKIIVRLFIAPILPLKMCQFDSDRFSLGDETLVKRKCQKNISYPVESFPKVLSCAKNIINYNTFPKPPTNLGSNTKIISTYSVFLAQSGSGSLVVFFSLLKNL